MPTDRLTLHFYTRADCPLCEKASQAMRAVFAQLPDVPVEVIERDIDTNADWHDAYKWDIPVLELEGERLFTYRVHAPRLERDLRDAWDART
ncbi:MAG: glutaredoxin family protein [Candidatus Poribacteria bacterium]|nr:glutaredoxin family protein [Candidatus Poribacteria bacterium]